MENGLLHYNYHQAYLRLKILGAEGIDEPNLHPSVLNRDYFVVLWVRPGEEYYTRTVKGLPNPIWNTDGPIFLREYPNNHTYLHLEILRFKSVNDPGTSNGIVVVGRARIPLPKKFDNEKRGRFGLVRADHNGEGYKAEGHIVLSMELKMCN